MVRCPCVCPLCVPLCVCVCAPPVYVPPVCVLCVRLQGSITLVRELLDRMSYQWINAATAAGAPGPCSLLLLCGATQQQQEQQ